MKNGWSVAFIIIALLQTGSLACLEPPAPQEAAQPPMIQEGESDKQVVTSPVASQSDLTTLIEGNNAFAFDAYQHVKGDGNIFFSPYSMSLVLAMTYAGAGGSTEQQIADTLHFTLPQERLHPAFNSLNLELNKRGQAARGKDGKPFRLNLINAIWGQNDYAFLQDFLDTLDENYGSGLRLLDFRNAPEISRITINDWVNDQTEERIKELIPPDEIDGLTRLVLTNAIYFNAAWQFVFDKNATTGRTFHRLNGGEVTVPMMFQIGQFGYAAGNDCQAVELPYDGHELAMMVLLPQSGKFTVFEQSLDAAKVERIVDSLAQEDLELALPRFEFLTSSMSLKKALSNMGMPAAFISPPGLGPCLPEYANFSGMDVEAKCNLYVRNIFQKAFISVDERGTEAAVATFGSEVPSGPSTMIIDRPFIFLIRDIKTGTILFMGRMMDPSIKAL